MTKQKALFDRLAVSPDADASPPQPEPAGDVQRLHASLVATQRRPNPNRILTEIAPAAFAAAAPPVAGSFRIAADVHDTFLRRPAADEGPAAAAAAAAAGRRLNHMGKPGRRGCGKGNWVEELQGGGPWVFGVEPALPPGLALDPGTGCICGAPLAPAPEAEYTVTAANKVTGSLMPAACSPARAGILNIIN